MLPLQAQRPPAIFARNPRNIRAGPRVSNPMETYRGVALTALRTALLVGLAALFILVLLPVAVAAQAAAR